MGPIESYHRKKIVGFGLHQLEGKFLAALRTYFKAIGEVLSSSRILTFFE